MTEGTFSPEFDPISLADALHLTEAFTVFIDMTISVLRLMSDRLTTALPKAANLNLDSLLLSFCTYVQRLGFSLQAYRLKIRLCQVCEILLLKRGQTSQDSVFKNKLLENLINWASNLRPVSLLLQIMSSMLKTLCYRSETTRMRATFNLS